MTTQLYTISIIKKILELFFKKKQRLQKLVEKTFQTHDFN